MELYDFQLLNRQKGFHFFERATMRFFKSRVSNWDEQTGLFITSEKGPSNVCKYTIRQANFKSGAVDTLGNFQAYNTIGAAKTALKNIRVNVLGLLK